MRESHFKRKELLNLLDDMKQMVLYFCIMIVALYQ